ncbi:hypothetical protein OHAE_5155 [Ochrobactrum soli]|uniref:Uncharacterized protein n=1 Tax=Ochrobactrum soli TaxID=2448455 RepID=A0A2P9HEM4_9HYPH|nr:hypothetical protein OHAE_5155 [[Ochrobactrum] soli]
MIAVASGQHESFLRELGADEFVDYQRTAAETFVRDADLVVDAVDGWQSRDLCRVRRPSLRRPCSPEACAFSMMFRACCYVRISG